MSNPKKADSSINREQKQVINSPDTSKTRLTPPSDSINLNDSMKKDAAGRKADTSKRSRLEAELGIKISKDAMNAIITADATDSAVMDMQNYQFYLYRKAKVNYEDKEVVAGQVSFNQANNTIAAAPYVYEKDTAAQKQSFTQGKEKFTYDSMLYNIKTQRAIVRNVHSQYGDGYVHSEQIKRNPDQTIYGYHSVYTTCALDTPHFGIFATKIKVIPGKLIVSGPANLEIEGIPTPFWLPFGIFPTTEKQKSGFILPTYSIEAARGLGLLNGGYYFYLNDHVDLLAQANIYTKGSYSLNTQADYRSMYHYSGQFQLAYAYNKTGEDFEPLASITKDYRINWSHTSDAKAVPGQSFSAHVDAGTSTYYSVNSLDINKQLQNQYQSNITYAKNWQGKPYSLTISALYNQNVLLKQTNLTLPAVNFHVAQINPFQNKSRVGSRWYDKVTASYSTEMLNRTSFYDSTFSLANQSLSKFQSGIHHSIPVSASYTVMRYINMSFSVNYNEYWLTDKLYLNYNDAEKKLDSNETHGFYTARDFNAGLSFSTRIYGMKLFKHSSLRGIRHVLSPSVGLSYHPDFGASPFNYYYQTRLDTSQRLTYLSPYSTSIVGIPPLGKSGAVNFGLNNNLQIKVRSSKDTVSGYKNITLIDALGINASYNPAVDSFRWSTIGANFRTNIMDKINVSSNATFDPYAKEYNFGRRTPQLMLDKGYGLARFTGASLALGTNFHSKAVGGDKDRTNSEEYARIVRSAGYNDYVDFNVPWSFNVSYSLSAANNFSSFSHNDTVIINHTLTMQGEVQLTKRWKITLSSGYNFNAKELSSTSIDIYRDLHCWAMHMQTIPFGPRKSFNFTLNVKSSILQDLKLQRRRDYRDSPY